MLTSSFSIFGLSSPWLPWYFISCISDCVCFVSIAFGIPYYLILPFFLQGFVCLFTSKTGRATLPAVTCFSSITSEGILTLKVFFDLKESLLLNFFNMLFVYFMIKNKRNVHVSSVNTKRSHTKTVAQNV